MNADSVIIELKSQSNAIKAEFFLRFFKAGKGEYAEGDKFLGVTVPSQRTIAKKYKDIDLNEVEKLLKSEFHEARLTALLILTYKYAKANDDLKKEIYKFYLSNTQYINNWDLVDSSSYKIVGNYLLNNDMDGKVLYDLALSTNLWEQRIAIISTFEFIKNNSFEHTIKISKKLLNHKHDLIHKAVGWMLREMGKRDKAKLLEFLNKHYKKMPRTMLRYSIEKLNKQEKLKYMQK